jgi:phosphoribosylformylglycinamidine cyclo-ligase
VLVAIPSSGFHSNGYSLVRKAVFSAGGLKIDAHVPELGQTVAEALLTPTRIYSSQVAGVVAKFLIDVELMGIAHITGGGLGDNITRLLPEGCAIRIDRSSWTPNPVFSWVQGLGKIDREEMYRVFNMGIGMVFIVGKGAADKVVNHLKAAGETVHVIGEVIAGEQNCVYES